MLPVPQDGAEEALSSSQDNRPTVPHPLRRRIPRVSAPGSQIPSMAFTHNPEARLPLAPRLSQGFCDDAAGFASCYGPAVRSPPKIGDFVVPLRRWDLSAHREPATRDPGVSPDRTHTGWLS